MTRNNNYDWFSLKTRTMRGRLWQIAGKILSAIRHLNQKKSKRRVSLNELGKQQLEAVRLQLQLQM